MLKQSLMDLNKVFKDTAPLYIVGGCVRDMLLNNETKDIDLASELELDRLKEMLTGTNFELVIKNKPLGTASIKNNSECFEYSTFRKDVYNENKKYHHSPKSVVFTKNLEEDALRRDFTINAIYYSLKEDKIVDVVNGVYDLKHKLLRMVTPTTLNYDGERILRLARFKIGLGFEVEKETLKSAKENHKNVLALTDSTIKKFLNDIKNFSLTQKESLKEFFNELNLNEISKLIN